MSRNADTWPEAVCPNRGLLYIWHLGRPLSSLAPRLTIQDGCSLHFAFKEGKGKKKKKVERNKCVCRPVCVETDRAETKRQRQRYKLTVLLL